MSTGDLCFKLSDVPPQGEVGWPDDVEPVLGPDMVFARFLFGKSAHLHTRFTKSGLAGQHS